MGTLQFSLADYRIAIRERERESMEVTQVNYRVLDRILSLFRETFSWVKTKLESFFKLLRTDLITALLSVKPLIINCWEKIKLALARINDFTDGRVDRLPAEAANNNPEEISVVDESKKLIKKMAKLVGHLARCEDPELRRKGEILKGFLGLAEGFTDLVDLSFKHPLQLLRILLNGHLLYKNCAVKQVSHIACKFQNYKDKGVTAVAALLTLFSFQPIH